MSLLRWGGRVAQCKGLQIPKTVGSNPTLTSRLFRASVTVAQQTPNLFDGVQFPGSEPL